MKRTHTAGFILSAGVIIAALFNLFFYLQTPGISLVIFFIIVFAISQSGKFLKSQHFIIYKVDFLFLPLFLVSLIPFLSQNQFLSVVSFFIVIFLTPYLGFLSSKKLKLASFGFVSSLNNFFLRYIEQFEAPSQIRALRTQSSNSKPQFSTQLWRVVSGMLIISPVLLILVLLLGSADEAFRQIFDLANIFSAIFSFESIVGIILFVEVLLISLSILTSWYKDSKDDIPNLTPPPKRMFDPVKALVASISVNIILAVFVAIQFVYLFGDYNNISKLGITYAEYARRGFFELFYVSLIVMGITYLINKYGLAKSETPRTIQKTNLIIKIILSFVVLISALHRLNLYTNTYGLTQTRFFVQVLFVFLGIMFAIIAAGVISESINRYFSSSIFVTGCLLLFFVGVINPDVQITRTNVLRAAITSRPLDTEYLIERLSSDAYPVILDAYTVDLERKDLCRMSKKWNRESEERSNFFEANLTRLINYSKLESKLGNQDDYCN